MRRTHRHPSSYPLAATLAKPDSALLESLTRELAELPAIVLGKLPHVPEAPVVGNITDFLRIVPRSKLASDSLKTNSCQVSFG